jgi:hypothetical protein
MTQPTKISIKTVSGSSLPFPAFRSFFLANAAFWRHLAPQNRARLPARGSGRYGRLHS